MKVTGLSPTRVRSLDREGTVHDLDHRGTEPSLTRREPDSRLRLLAVAMAVLAELQVLLSVGSSTTTLIVMRVPTLPLSIGNLLWLLATFSGVLVLAEALLVLRRAVQRGTGLLSLPGLPLLFAVWLLPGGMIAARGALLAGVAAALMLLDVSAVGADLLGLLSRQVHSASAGMDTGPADMIRGVSIGLQVLLAILAATTSAVGALVGSRRRG